LPVARLCVCDPVYALTEVCLVYEGVSRLAGHLEASSRIIVSNIAFGLEVFLSFICIITQVILYIWNFSIVSICLPLLVGWMISIILSIGPMECPFSRRCCANRDFVWHI
jgi:hypothetical protein